MLLLIILAFALMAVATVLQYQEEARDYHTERLQRKEASIKQHINFVLEETTYPVTTENIPLIFKEEIYTIKQVHNLEVFLYDLQGNLLKSSKATFFRDTTNKQIPARDFEELRIASDKHFVREFEENGETYQSSYSYITDQYFKPLAILNLPYIEDDGFIAKELSENLTRLAIAYAILLLIAIGLAYLLSKYITRSLNAVREKIIETRLDQRNKRILIDNTTEEISHLVDAYNGMIDELESSAARLAASEREAAWREMAKQVAHEIKNPLTPMRLTVQSFQRKFDKDDPNLDKKLNEFSDTIIQQIDTMSSIASAFSNYADMPAQQDETLNVVKITKLALDIFNEDYIYYFAEEDEVIAKFDRTQLIRVITNLVKNSIDSINQEQPLNPRINVRVFRDDRSVCISVEDNGEGISKNNEDKIFEPKFTTKSSGMGLGLAMVKNIVETYNGTISFESSEGNGATFNVRFPRQV